MTKITGENWVGFNDRIRKQQVSRGYLLVKGRVIKEKVQLSSNKLKKNTLKVKQAKELKSEEVELNKFYKSKVIGK